MFSINPLNSSSSTCKFTKLRESNTQIPTRASLFSPQIQPLFPSSSSSHFFHTPAKISAKKMNTDAELASELASKIEKMNTQLAQREEAIKKSSEILFQEMCKHLEMQESEVMKKWKIMSEDDKLGLVKEFVFEWGGDFQPLSAKSVIEMVEVYLSEDGDYEDSDVFDSDDDDSSPMFGGLLNFFGLSQNK
ncbi:hypothetical protein ACET3Z_030800 [Daucus carota]